MTKHLRHRPPALAEALLTRILPKGNLGSSILGDLRQDFIARCDSVSTGAARRWYWRQTVSLGSRYLGVRRRRPETPSTRQSVGGHAIALDSVVRDIRYAIRTLSRSPGYTVTAALMLALGVGGTTAMFSVVNTVLLRPLPYGEPDGLVRIWGLNRGNLGNVAPHDFLDWQQQSTTLSNIAALTGSELVTTEGGTAERLVGIQASSELLDVLGLTTALGRFYTKEEDTPGGNPVVVLGHGYWTRRFGADPTIIGSTLLLDGTPRTVIGVMNSNFLSPVSSTRAHPDFIRPAQLSYDNSGRGGHWLKVVARLAPETSFERAGSEMLVIQEELAKRYNMPTFLLRFERLDDSLLGSHRRALWILLGAVGFVLAIACANIANLSLARATGRAREMSTRAALGAGKGRLLSQLLVESVLLSLMGGGLGLALGWIGTQALVALGPQDLPRLQSNSLDIKVVIVALTVSIASGVVFGIVPALRSSTTQRRLAGQYSSRSVTESHRQRRVQHGFIILQAALSMMLLVGAGLLLRSFLTLQHVDPGFVPENVLTAELSLPRTSYPSAAVVPFYQELETRIRGIAGVQRVGTALAVPLSGWHSCNTFALDDRADPPPEQRTCVEERLVTPGYFETMGMSLLAGRGFTERDNGDALPVAIVNETFAREFWPDRGPLGVRFSWGDRGPDAQWRTIVGVVGDVRHFGLSQPVPPQVYWAYAQTPWYRDFTLAVQSAVDPTTLIPQLRAELAAIDDDLPLYNIETMDNLLSESLRLERFRTVLLSLFGGAALILTVIGLYGVLAYAVAQRSRELGLRIALGAQRAEILTMVLRKGLTLAAVGTSIGLVGALAVTRVLERLLFEVTPTDPVTIGVVVVLFGVAATLACYLPARRAMAADPMAALRAD